MVFLLVLFFLIVSGFFFLMLRFFMLLLIQNFFISMDRIIKSALKFMSANLSIFIILELVLLNVLVSWKWVTLPWFFTTEQFFYCVLDVVECYVSETLCFSKNCSLYFWVEHWSNLNWKHFVLSRSSSLFIPFVFSWGTGVCPIHEWFRDCNRVYKQNSGLLLSGFLLF